MLKAVFDTPLLKTTIMRSLGLTNDDWHNLWRALKLEGALLETDNSRENVVFDVQGSRSQFFGRMQRLSRTLVVLHLGDCEKEGFIVGHLYMVDNDGRSNPRPIEGHLEDVSPNQLLRWELLQDNHVAGRPGHTGSTFIGFLRDARR